ncbi:hypothetical protein [Streptomyces sp. NPDC002685]|uniref:hypothetical protein n=1 Tax=Streptomyces sp. NPDC002685 TaxID=3154540 RepID=UPI00333490F5
MPDTKRGWMVRCPTSSEAVAFAMNARVVAACCDPSYDCIRCFTVDLLTTECALDRVELTHALIDEADQPELTEADRARPAGRPGAAGRPDRWSA